MFLNMLRAESQQLFLETAYTLAHVDGMFVEAEKEVLKAYCREMETAFDIEHAPIALQDLKRKMSASLSPTEKKIVIFELLGLALADGEYGAEERTVMQALGNDFGLADSYGDQCEALLKKYFEMPKALASLVLG